MKSFSHLVFTLLFLSNLAAQPSWKLIDASDFSIEFPAEPIYEAQTAPSPIGELKMDIRMYEVVEIEKDDNYVYGIINTEYPEGTAHSDDKASLPQIFEGAVNGAVANANGKLLSNKEIVLDGYPGREFRIDFQDGLAVIKMRAYLVKNKMFILQTICDPKKESNPAAERFFASFKLKS